MTRAETIVAIKEHWGAPANDCVTPLPECDRCAIAWLLQEIEYLNAQLYMGRRLHQCECCVPRVSR